MTGAACAPEPPMTPDGSAVAPPEADAAIPLRPLAIVRRALPAIAAAAGVAFWLWETVPRPALLRALAPVRPAVVGAVAIAWACVCVTADLVGFGLVWRRHLAPTFAWRDVVTTGCGRLLLAPLVPGFTKLIPLLVLWRRAGVRPARFVGASQIIDLADAAVLTAAAIVALVVAGAPCPPLVAAALAGYQLAIVAALGFHRASHRLPSLARWRRRALIEPFAQASGREALRLVALRLVHLVFSTVCIAVVLRELGIALPAVRLLAFGPLLLFSGFLPFSVGGYGAPQGLAVLLLARSWHACTPAEALGFSLVWSTGVLLVQVTLGLLALPRLSPLLGRPEVRRG
jgi:hypothetical protein